MERAEKVEAVETLKGVFSEAGVVVVAHYAGMSVAEMTGLRTRLRKADASLKVIKNRLAKIALDEAVAEQGASLFEGPTAIVYSPDAVGATKAVVDYAKENEKFVLRGGILGLSVLDEAGVQALSKMPSLEEMRAKLVGSLNAPGGMFARTLNAPAQNFARSLNGIGPNLLSVLTQRQSQLEAA